MQQVMKVALIWLVSWSSPSLDTAVNDCKNTFDSAPVLFKSSTTFRLISTPDAVSALISEGTVSIEQLREVARNATTYNQRFWAVYCLGAMSRQERDAVFVESLLADNAWVGGHAKGLRALWLERHINSAVRSIRKHTRDEE
jgi:hypothetical protein